MSEPTDKPPCLEGCRLAQGHAGDYSSAGYTPAYHAPGCPNAPKEPAAPVDVGPDSEWQREAEENGRRAQSAAPRCECGTDEHNAGLSYRGNPLPGIRYGGLMCPHGMVRGACAICRNPPPSPKPEAESVEPWKPEAEIDWPPSMDAYLALRAEVEALNAALQSIIDAVPLGYIGSGTETPDDIAAKVIARDASLRAEVERLKPYEERWELARKAMPNAKIMQEVDAVMRLRAELVEMKAKLQKAEEWERSSANIEALLRDELAKEERHSVTLSESLAKYQASAALRHIDDLAKLAAERSAREQAEKERDELALLTVPSDEDAQLAVRLRIAEAEIGEIIAAYEESASSELGHLIEVARARRSAKGGANG